MRPSPLVRPPGPRLVSWALLGAAFAVSIAVRAPSQLLDDGAWLARYALHTASGEIWRWNLGEPPVWGATAPFHPLIVALPIALGGDPVTASIGVGVVLGSGAMLVATAALRDAAGWPAAAAFAVFVAMSSKVAWFLVSGLETPSTLLLLALAMRALTTRSRATPLVLAALAVHKIDLAPLALLGAALASRPSRAVGAVVAALVAWHGLAWWIFGGPLPLGFLTKVAPHPGGLPPLPVTWFGGTVLGFGAQKLMTVLAAAGAWRPGPAGVFCIGAVAIHGVAYTLFRPVEPYDWYTTPATFAVIAVAALGFARIAAAAPRLAWAGLVAFVVLDLPGEVRRTEQHLANVARIEGPRVEAGRWVAAHTSTDARVLTAWGNPALHARRAVIDASFHNRAREEGDLAARYAPEVILAEGNAGTERDDPKVGFTTIGWTLAGVFGSQPYHAVYVR